MARQNEQMTVDFNVFVGGLSLLGIATSVTPPNIEMSMIESDAYSAGKAELAYGAVENMELEFTLGTYNKVIYDEMAKMNEGEVTLKEAVTQGKVGDNIGIEIVARGQISAFEESDFKRGEKKEHKIKMKSLLYYKKSVNGEVVCEIDKPNSIVKPDGKTDMLEQSRKIVEG